MPDHLFIILGAGASFDCTSGNVPEARDERRPPLTKELFASRFTNTLHVYPLAEAAAADIQPAIAAETFALEEFLRTELRDSTHEHRRQQFRAVPLYLQHLLFDASAWDPGYNRGYTPHPDNYNRLISAALELEEAVFITLNYDTLLDQRLFAYEPLTSMDSYIPGPERNWSLIKLHGSVNWGRRVIVDWEVQDPDPYLATTFAALGEELRVEDDVTLRLSADLRGVRFEGTSSAAGGRLYYPALSAPLGPGDELVCPPNHAEYLRKRLAACDGLNLLVIGYSGLDEEVLKLLAESGNSLRSLAIVSQPQEAAEEAAHIITRSIGFGGPRLSPTIFGHGFNAFAQGDDLRAVIENLP
jgi:hypothetical protein